MNRKRALGIAFVVVGLAALGVVGVVAYNLGLGAHGGVARPMFGPMRGYFGGDGFGFGGFGAFGGFGLLGALIVGLLLVWILAALISGPAGGASRPATDPASVERLRELADMHDKGTLTDEEFAAAKRKLLGL